MVECLVDLYDSSFSDLLNPARMIIRIRDAYQVIESTTPVMDTDGAPRHWDANLFTEVPYRQVEKIFDDILDVIEGDLKEYGVIPAMNLNLSSYACSGQSSPQKLNGKRQTTVSLEREGDGSPKKQRNS
ncbi:hypothetical protein DXG03_001079 [Asterophora parasitica]|uniref:Uncharacterized protein n=1 Tax=Asterophora parasitica TaxID=117018 RepID=A0A9P7GAV7_9AGAR|nr:hypothetical protein DXG03_001079 [Asterophora parasitica]